jgi:hypothetical protein
VGNLAALRPPSPPFVELGFYSEHLRPEDLLSAVATALLERGGQVESCHVHKGRAAVGSMSISDYERVRIPLNSLDGVSGETADLLISIELSNVLKYDKGRYTSVTRVIDRVEPSAALVAVLGSGTAFEGARSAKLGKAGTELNEVFAHVIRLVKPTYATITVDWPIVSHRAIRENPKKVADYADFFVAASFVGRPVIDELSTLSGSSQLDDGVLVLTTSCFGGTGANRTLAGAAFVKATSRRR